ncbi:hypothetical protein D3C85_1797110 [compost metagenome]
MAVAINFQQDLENMPRCLGEFDQQSSGVQIVEYQLELRAFADQRGGMSEFVRRNANAIQDVGKPSLEKEICLTQG